MKTSTSTDDFNTDTTPSPHEPFVLPAGLAPSEDLTFRAQAALGADEFPFDGEAKYQRLFDSIARTLHRRSGNHALLTGERGVGKSTIVAEMARRAADGEIPFLQGKRFLWVDARYVPPMESGQRLAGILSHVATHGEVVLCIDGLVALCCREQGADHRMFLLSVLSRAPVQILGVVTPHEFEEITSDLPEMLEFFNRIDVEEPDVPLAQKLMQHYAAGLQESFQVAIDGEAVRQSVALSSNYILNERLPAKALRVLSRCCENVDYEREIDAEGRGDRETRREGDEAGDGGHISPHRHPRFSKSQNWRVTADDVVAEVSRISGEHFRIHDFVPRVFEIDLVEIN